MPIEKLERTFANPVTTTQLLEKVNELVDAHNAIERSVRAIIPSRPAFSQPPLTQELRDDVAAYDVGPVTLAPPGTFVIRPNEDVPSIVPEKIDPSNTFGVCAAGIDRIGILAPPSRLRQIEKLEALTMAAWIVAVSGVDLAEFVRLYYAVAET